MAKLTHLIAESHTQSSWGSTSYENQSQSIRLITELFSFQLEKERIVSRKGIVRDIVCNAWILLPMPAFRIACRCFRKLMQKLERAHY